MDLANLALTGQRFDPPLYFLEPLGLDLKLPAHVAALRALVASEGFDFMTIDPLVNYHTADENSSNEMAQVMVGLHSIVKAGCTLVVVHHTSKQPQGPSMGSRSTVERLRGSSVIGGALSMQLNVTRVGDSQRHHIERVGKSVKDSETIKDVVLDTETWLWSAGQPLDREKVLKMVEQKPGSTGPEVAKGLGYRKGAVEEILKQFVEEGILKIVTGSHNRKEYHVI